MRSAVFAMRCDGYDHGFNDINAAARSIQSSLALKNTSRS